MADIALYTANQVTVAESFVQQTGPTGGAVTAGSAVRIDANGKFIHGNATTATGGVNAIYGIARRTCASGETITAIRKGVLDGYDVEALAYWAPVYLSDTAGRLADAAGTTTVIVGRVIPVYGEVMSGSGLVPHKAILLDVP
jgi:hypothetical protein